MDPSKNVSNLSMQVYPLLESVKDNMVASTIRKGDTLRIQARGSVGQQNGWNTFRLRHVSN